MCFCPVVSAEVSMIWVAHFAPYPLCHPRLPRFSHSPPPHCLHAFPTSPAGSLSILLIHLVTSHLPPCPPETSMFLCGFLSFHVPCVSHTRALRDACVSPVSPCVPQQEPSQLLSAASPGQCLLALRPPGGQPQRSGLPLPPRRALWPPGSWHPAPPGARWGFGRAAPALGRPWSPGLGLTPAG